MFHENNKRLSEIFRTVAVILEILEDNPFRAKAFERASFTIENLDEDICTLAEEEKLEKLPGIGKALSYYIQSWCKTGTFEEYEKLKSLPYENLLELLEIPGLGPKKVKLLYHQLGISSLGELEYACLENRLSEVKGFGPKTQEKVLKAIEDLKKRKKYRHAPQTYEIAQEFLSALETVKSIKKVLIVGGLRRFQEVFDDIDLLVEPASSSWIEDIQKLLTNTTISHEDPLRIQGDFLNFRIDIRKASGPDAYFYFTGNKIHTKTMCDIAKTKGFSVRGYEFFKEDKRVSFRSEEELYESFGLSYIPPELREGLGEIEASKNSTLPKLIEKEDIKGLFHIHTNLSDGALELEKIITYALSLGYSYIGISDHSVSAYYAGGLTLEKIKRQKEDIEYFRKKYPQIDIYWGIESDIRQDGSLDYPEDILKDFDFVIGSIHSQFKMDKESMTNRIIKALSNPFLTILGHPSGRLILGRPAYEVDMESLLKTAKDNGKIIELNSHPYRLDLEWRYCIKAKNLSIPVSINPDAHKLEDFDISYGVMSARKGWLSSQEIWNAKSREEMKAIMKEKPWRRK